MLDKIRNMMTAKLTRKPAENHNTVIIDIICIQECTELAKACTDDIRRLLSDTSLRCDADYINVSINEEVADVLITIANLMDANVIDEETVLEWAERKLERYESIVNQKGGMEELE